MFVKDMGSEKFLKSFIFCNLMRVYETKVFFKWLKERTQKGIKTCFRPTMRRNLLKSVHFKKPVTRSSFLSKSVVIFVVVILKMTTF